MTALDTHATKISRLAELNELSLVDAALRYIWAGIPVFPLRPSAKEPATTHGFQDATIDPDRVARWWSRWPHANIGIPTGTAFADVLDVDVKNGAPGMESFLKLRSLGLAAPAWAIAGTPSGGLHACYAPSGLRNHSRHRLGLDVRAEGGYIVAAPSRLDRSRYQWAAVDTTRYGEPLPWQRILDLLEPRPAPRPRANGGHGGLGSLYRFVSELCEGNRNHGLFWAACCARDDGEDPWALLPAALACGLSEREARATIGSAARGRAA